MPVHRHRLLPEIPRRSNGWHRPSDIARVAQITTYPVQRLERGYWPRGSTLLEGELLGQHPPVFSHSLKVYDELIEDPSAPQGRA
jgi:hypothetical protein